MAGADLDNKVAGVPDRIAGDGEAPLHQRLIELHGPVNGIDCRHIVHHAAGIGREHTQLQVLAGDDGDQRTLAALGVLGLHRLDIHPVVTLAGLLHGRSGFGLVVFHNHDTLGIGEQPQHILHALHDLGGLGAHKLIVTGDVGLAFRAVGNDVVDFLRGLDGELYMGGEACAAHTHDTGLLDLGKNLLAGEAIHIAFHAHAFSQGVRSIVLHDDGHGAAAGGVLSGLHRLHRAGHGADDVGGHEAAGLCDNLTRQNMVTLLHHGGSGLADVLIGHIDQFTLGKQLCQGAFLGKLLVLRRMDTAMECFDFHVYLSLLHSDFPGSREPPGNIAFLL